MNFVDHNFLLILILVDLIFHRLKFSSLAKHFIIFVFSYLFISFTPIIFSLHTRTFEKYNSVTTDMFLHKKTLKHM